MTSRRLSSPSPSASPSHRRHVLLLAVGVSASSLLLLVLLLLLFLFYFYLSLRRSPTLPLSSNTSPANPLRLRRFSYRALRSATASFDPSRSLGRGASAAVFRGVLPDGKSVAVKRLLSSAASSDREFHNELHVLAALRPSPFVVSLLGYCLEGRRRRLLVYEYMPNGSLQEALFGSSSPLNWDRRFSIILDVAQALAFLHLQCDPPVVHGDIKPSNVLLGFDFQAKISDFGLSQMKADAELSSTTSMRGTVCYVAPECHHGCDQLMEKADMYSFGVLILVIVSGRRPLHVLPSPAKPEKASLVSWCRRLLQAGNLLELVDERLKDAYDKEQASLCINLALLCLQRIPELRPDGGDVVRILKGEMELPAVPCELSPSPPARHHGRSRRKASMDEE
ncbi:STYKc [Musa troglodytarum]|uniref:STYKc n=1 Tax=Musa troglodytarum TaxID=320322 RepID=A0A9E7HK33_9LILI|nr:STYKc [Musa troglodytarum]